MTGDQLFQLKNKRAETAERVDITDIKIDTAMPISQRALEYFRQIQNPYAFKWKEIAVNVRFSTDGRTLEDALVYCLAAAEKDAGRL